MHCWLLGWLWLFAFIFFLLVLLIMTWHGFMKHGMKSKLVLAFCTPESGESERTNHNHGLVVQLIQLQEHTDYSTLDVLLLVFLNYWKKKKTSQELAPKTVPTYGLLYAAVLARD